MKRLLTILLVCWSWSAWSQPIQRNSWTTNANGRTPNILPTSTNVIYPLMVLNPDGSGGDRQLLFSQYLTLTGTNTTLGGNLSLNGRTNKLSIANDALLLDGVAVTSTTNAPVNNFYATNIYSQHGSHNTMVVSNTFTLLPAGPSKILRTDSNTNVVAATIGTGLAFDGTTLSATSSGGQTAGFVIDANQFIQANQTNIDAGTAGTNAFVIIGGSGSSITNAMVLTNAYAKAKLKTPNGAALAANNRYTIFLLPGVYDLGSGTLTMDTSYIDLVGLSPHTGALTYIASFSNYGDTVLKSSGNVVSINASDVALANLALVTSAAGSRGLTSSAGFGVEFQAINLLISNSSAVSNPGMQQDIAFAGRWIDVRCWNTGSFGGGNPGTVAGYYLRCKAGAEGFVGGSFAGGGITISGTFIDCEAGGGSFGGGGNRTITMSGTFIGCRFNNPMSAGGAFFGQGPNTTFSGTFLNIDAQLTSAFEGTLTGTMAGCTSLKNSDLTVDTGGVISDCYFAAASLTYTAGLVKDCTFGTNTFSKGLVISSSASFASTDTTAAVAIAATGWTNTFNKNATVYFDGTAVTATVFNGAGTAIYTNAVATTGMGTVNLKPGGKVILSGTSVTGRATTF